MGLVARGAHSGRAHGVRALDLFCGGGGAALGMIAAGFDVTGVDIEPKHAKVYPGKFVCGDATNPPFDLADFDFVWASPPCQAFSVASKMRGTAHKHPDMIPDVRALLYGHPMTAIENVPGAPIRSDVVLTGPMVGLNRIVRRRHFELSWFPGLLPPPITRLGRKAWSWKNGNKGAVCITKRLCSPMHWYPRKKAGLPGRITPEEACEAMGIDLPMDGSQVGESIPPAYAEFIARSVLMEMAHMEVRHDN